MRRSRKKASFWSCLVLTASPFFVVAAARGARKLSSHRSAISMHASERLRFTRAHRVNARPRESLRPSARTKPRIRSAPPHLHATCAPPASMVCGCCAAPPIWMRCVLASGFLLMLRAACSQPPANRAAQASHAHRTQRLPLLNLASTLLMSQLSGKRSERVCTLAVRVSKNPRCASKQARTRTGGQRGAT